MKRFLCILIIGLAACKVEVAPDGLLREVPDDPALAPSPTPTATPTASPTPVPTPGPGAECAGEYLVGRWTTPSDPTEVWEFYDDCTGHNYACNYDFEYLPQGDPLGWIGNFNFKVFHVSGPNQVLPGCTQYHQVHTQWHWCNILPDTDDHTRMDCNAEVNSFYFDREDI